MSQGDVSSLERCALFGIPWSEINDEPLAIRAAQETFDSFKSHPVYDERWITLPFSEKRCFLQQARVPVRGEERCRAHEFRHENRDRQSTSCETRTTLTWPTMDPTVLRRSPQQVEEMLDTSSVDLDTMPLRSALVEGGKEMQNKFEKARHRLKVFYASIFSFSCPAQPRVQ